MSNIIIAAIAGGSVGFVLGVVIGASIVAACVAVGKSRRPEE